MLDNNKERASFVTKIHDKTIKADDIEAYVQQAPEEVIFATDPKGKTILHELTALFTTERWRYYEWIKCLRLRLGNEKFAKLLKQTDNHGNTLLHDAILNGDEFFIEYLFVQFLYKNSTYYDLNFCAKQNNDGETPLHIAMRTSNKIAIDRLLPKYTKEHMALKDNQGKTALNLLARHCADADFFDTCLCYLSTFPEVSASDQRVLTRLKLADNPHGKNLETSLTNLFNRTAPLPQIAKNADIMVQTLLNPKQSFENKLEAINLFKKDLYQQPAYKTLAKVAGGIAIAAAGLVVGLVVGALIEGLIFAVATGGIGGIFGAAHGALLCAVTGWNLGLAAAAAVGAAVAVGTYEGAFFMTNQPKRSLVSAAQTLAKPPLFHI